MSETKVGKSATDGGVTLALTRRETDVLHHAISTVVTLIDEVGSVPLDAPLGGGARDELVTIARRLDHERRHRGAVPNPNGPVDGA